MSVTKSFIETLDDSEICFLSKYKKHQYLPSTQQLIEDELMRRRISPALIEEVVKRVSDIQLSPEETGTCCPRCKSDKWYAMLEENEVFRGWKSGRKIVRNFTEESLDELPSSRMNEVIYYDRCVVCDYSLHGHQPPSSNKNSILKKILNWFN